MKRRLAGYLFLLLCLCLMCTGCEKMHGNIDFNDRQSLSQADGTIGNVNSSKRPLRIAFASVISPRETRQSYQKMVDYIAEQMNIPAVLIQRKTYEELNMLLASGDADIAFLSTGSYTAYHGMQAIELLAMTQTDGTVFYKSYLIVPKDSDITDFSQLEGRVFAFTDPMSYSGRLAIDYLLLEEYHTTAERYFSRCFYTYNHDKSLWAVANHLADGAGIDSQIYDFAQRTSPDLVDKVRIIASMKPAPTGPVVMRQDLPEDTKLKLRNVFYNMDKVETLQPVMSQVLIDRFVEPQEDAYSELRQKYNQRERMPGD